MKYAVFFNVNLVILSNTPRIRSVKYQEISKLDSTEIRWNRILALPHGKDIVIKDEGGNKYNLEEFIELAEETCDLTDIDKEVFSSIRDSQSLPEDENYRMYVPRKKPEWDEDNELQCLTDSDSYYKNVDPDTVIMMSELMKIKLPRKNKDGGYDMCKAVQKDMVITDIHLVSKSGGKSGDYHWKGE